MTQLDRDRLATAMVDAFRDLAKQKWPWLAGDGWPAYSERVKGHDMSQVFIVNEIAEAVANEYEAPARIDAAGPQRGAAGTSTSRPMVTSRQEQDR